MSNLRNSSPKKEVFRNHFQKLKARVRIVAFRREAISFLGFAFGQGVGFEVATFGRSDGQGLRIVVEAEA